LTPYRTILAIRDFVACVILSLEFITIGSLPMLIDVRTIVIVGTRAAPGFWRQKTSAIRHSGGTSRRIIVKLMPAAPLADVTADVFSSTPLLLALIVFTDFKSTTIIIAVTTGHAFARIGVAIGPN
jgi:hypothetical protein